MIAAAIVSCEVAFWITLGSGLSLRYPARRPRAGFRTLLAVPLTDLALLMTVATDLRWGAVATGAHNTALFYLGFSLAYGHRMIRWLDVRFAHRFADGPAPERSTGRSCTRLCWSDVARTAAACGLACVLAWSITAWVAAPARTQPLASSTYTWSAILIGAEMLWALGHTIRPRHATTNRSNS